VDPEARETALDRLGVCFGDRANLIAASLSDPESEVRAPVVQQLADESLRVRRAAPRAQLAAATPPAGPDRRWIARSNRPRPAKASSGWVMLDAYAPASALGQ